MKIVSITFETNPMFSTDKLCRACIASTIHKCSIVHSNTHTIHTKILGKYQAPLISISSNIQNITECMNNNLENIFEFIDLILFNKNISRCDNLQRL